MGTLDSWTSSLYILCGTDELTERINGVKLPVNKSQKLSQICAAFETNVIQSLLHYDVIHHI